MRLLIYSHGFPPNVGGVEKMVFSLAQGLARLKSQDRFPDFEVTVATPYPKGEFDDTSTGLSVVRKPSFLTLVRLIRLADLVHIAGPALAPLCIACSVGTPVVIEHHGYQATCLNGLLLESSTGAVCPGHFLMGHYGKCVRCYARESSLVSSLIQLLLMAPRYTLSRRVAANISITSHVMNRQKLPQSEVIYYGIADVLDESKSSRREASEHICFAYVGRLVQEKGIPVLLEAAALLRKEERQFKLLLVGDGPQRALLERTIQSNDLADVATITGYLQGSALEEKLREVDVVVMPSVWEETAGLAAIEQMMSGRLVIASDIGGLAEVVRDGGITFPAGSPTALADIMRAVIDRPSRFAAVANRARIRSLEIFGLQRMIEHHAETYCRVLRASRKTRALSWS